MAARLWMAVAALGPGLTPPPRSLSAPSISMHGGSESDNESEEDSQPQRVDVTACIPGYAYEDAFMRRERTFALQGGRQQLRVLQRFMELDGTAGTVWPVTEVFIREYDSLAHLWDARGKGVLELGSGTGLLAMFLAYHQARGVVATDVGEGFDLLQANLALEGNVAVLGEQSHVLRSALLRWDGNALQDLAGIRETCAAGGFDIDTVVLFDALYNQDALEPLSKVIRKTVGLFDTVRSLVVGYHDRQPEVEARGLQMVQNSFLTEPSHKLRITRLFDIEPVHALVIERI